MKQKILFFDGHCNLCNWAVNLLIRLDRRKILFYAPLSGATAKELALSVDHNKANQSVVYFRNKERIFKLSDAVIEVCTDIFPLGKVFYIFKLIPRFIRDSLYKWIAKHRYSFFGKKEKCRLPTPEEKERFLD